MSKGESTKAAILDRSLEIASVLGLEGLTISGVAKKAGLSKSGLFAHFASKEDLQVQVLQAAVAKFISLVVAPALRQPRGEPRVRSLFDSWMAWAAAMPGGCVFIGTANEVDDRPGRPRDYLVDAQRDWLAVLSNAARIGVEEGHFNSTLDVQQFAYDLYSIMLAYHHFHRLLRDRDAASRARESFENLLTNSR